MSEVSADLFVFVLCMLNVKCIDAVPFRLVQVREMRDHLSMAPRFVPIDCRAVEFRMRHSFHLVGIRWRKVSMVRCLQFNFALFQRVSHWQQTTVYLRIDVFDQSSERMNSSVMASGVVGLTRSRQHWPRSCWIDRSFFVDSLVLHAANAQGTVGLADLVSSFEAE